MMKYIQKIEKGYTIVIFDKIYHIKSIAFDKKIVELEWAINEEIYNVSNYQIKNSVVTFQNIYLRFLKIKGQVEVLNVNQGKGYIIDEAEQETNVFRRNSHWAGADGVFQHRIGNKLHWYFSDTFVGDVDPKTRLRKKGFVMVNNSVAVSLIGSEFDLTFKVNEKDGQYKAFYEPNQSGYLWIQDGIYLDGALYITCLNVSNSEDESVWFNVDGTSLVKVPSLNGDLLYDQYSIIESNFCVKDQDITYTFGAAILNDLERTGYIYVFGYGSQKERRGVMSRTKDFLDVKSYEYYSNEGWIKKPVDLFEIAPDFACELKVIFDDGLYKMAYTKGSLSSEIMMGETDDLEKGFKDLTLVYQCPEKVLKDGQVSYNAKLQKFDNIKELYISYNVNTMKNDDHVDAEIYYPRWIKLQKVSDVK